MQVIDLAGTPLDDFNGSATKRWYQGCGNAQLAVDAGGVPQALVYDDSGLGIRMSATALVRAAGADGKVLRGMCSCWSFCVEQVSEVLGS